MNILSVVVDNIQEEQSLHIVTFDFLGTKLKMMSLQLSKDIQVGKKSRLYFKPTNVAFGKDCKGLVSFANKIDAKVEKIEKGKLLTYVILNVKDHQIESIITTEVCEQMNLTIEDEVKIFLKANEISILGNCDD